MRLSKRHYKIIDVMKKGGYIWLSDLHINAQMRFRNRTRKGFDNFLKVEGLTFLTKELAESFSVGVKQGSRPRLTLTRQVERLQDKVASLERENQILRGNAPEELIKKID